MPKSISRKDSRIAYCAFRICENDKKMSMYSTAKTLHGQLVPLNGTRQIEYYGETIQYNAVAMFNLNEDSKFIDVATKFWFKDKPIDTTLTSAEYEVTGKTEPTDGIIKVFLMSTKPNNKTLYVTYQGKVGNVTIDYDAKQKKAHIPNDFYFPFTSADTFWERKPKSVLDMENAMRISIVEITENGKNIYFENR